MSTDNAVRHMSESLEQLHKLQEKGASGKNFTYASENPTGASLSLNLRSTLKTSKAYLDTASLTSDWMSASEFALQQLEDLALRAKNLSLAGLNDTLGSDERISALAVEVDAILKEGVDVANSNHKGQYIFAGFSINSVPIELRPYEPTDPLYDPANPEKQHAVYRGDAGVMQRSLGPSQSIVMNMTADNEIRPFLDALIDIRDALSNDNTTTLRAALGNLETAVNGLDQLRTSNGGRQRQVTSATEYLKKTQIELSSLLSQNEDANLAETISLIRSQEITYQAVLEVGSRAISAINLFEYLR
jgi:flagellar hook-associated protein 3 FlgL